MPRIISSNLRRALEEPRSDEYIVILIEIEHDQLAQPIRVANDVVDYIFEGNTFIGFPFEIEIVTDSKDFPRGQIRIQNVDQRISDTVLELVTPPRLRIVMLANSDFGDAALSPASARLPNDDIVVEYEATNLILSNITVDTLAITGEIKSFEMTNEPWPAIRATADRLPGLEP